MSIRVRLAILAAAILAVVLVSAWMRSQERHITPASFDQLRDDMTKADVIAILGEPGPAAYLDDGITPRPVELILGPMWSVLRTVESKSPGAWDGGIAERLEFVGPEWGISVSFNPAGKMAVRGLMKRTSLELE